MSSYLSIYGVERATDNKLLLVSYSRSNGFYQAINDNMSVVFDNGEEPQYSEITLENITDAMDDVKTGRVYTFSFTEGDYQYAVNASQED